MFFWANQVEKSCPPRLFEWATASTSHDEAAQLVSWHAQPSLWTAQNQSLSERPPRAVLPCGPHHRSVGFTDVLPCGVGSHSTHVVKTPQHSNQQRSKTVSCAKHLSSPRLLLAVHKNMVSVVIDVPLDLLSAVALQLSIRFFKVSTTVEVALVPQRSPVTQLRNAQCGCLSLCALGNPAANSLVWSAATASAQASASLSLSLCQAKECERAQCG